MPQFPDSTADHFSNCCESKLYLNLRSIVCYESNGRYPQSFPMSVERKRVWENVYTGAIKKKDCEWDIYGMGVFPKDCPLKKLVVAQTNGSIKFKE